MNPSLFPTVIPTSSSLHKEHVQLRFEQLSLSEMQSSSALQLSMREAIATILDISVSSLSDMEISADYSGNLGPEVLVELNVESDYTRRGAAMLLASSKVKLVQLLMADATVNGYENVQALDRVRMISAVTMTDNPTPSPSVKPTTASTPVPSALPSVYPTPFPSLYPTAVPTVPPTPLPSTTVFDHCSVHLTIAGLSEVTLGGSLVLQTVSRYCSDDLSIYPSIYLPIYLSFDFFISLFTHLMLHDSINYFRCVISPALL